jgi:hypothetical protein
MQLERTLTTGVFAPVSAASATAAPTPATSSLTGWGTAASAAANTPTSSWAAAAPSTATTPWGSTPAAVSNPGASSVGGWGSGASSLATSQAWGSSVSRGPSEEEKKIALKAGKVFYLDCHVFPCINHSCICK